MKRYLAGLAAILLMTIVGPALGQDQSDQAEQYPVSQQSPDGQQPTEAQPGAARVSMVQGDVSTQRGDNGQWVAVTVNTPVVPDDRVSTGDKSSAEVQLDWADTLRMSARATAKIASLTQQQIVIQVGQGLVTYNIFKGSDVASEIDTPNVSIRPQAGEGQYRILVNSDAETQLTVRSGSAEISTSQGSTRVESGQMVTIAGTDNPQFQVSNAPPKDDWDRYNSDRNNAVRSAQSWKKTNPYYVGSEDLDSHGQWTEVPDYGQVWVPAQDPGWAPYRDGRWVYEPYYGWTWVSYEPWGWAPYHYGRWFIYGGGWAWWPGPIYDYPLYRPVWAPAYVSFFGFGGGFGWGFGVGFGGGYGRVGWLPVGPCDWYHPWYGRGGRNVNVVNVTNINNTRIINNNGFAPLHGGRGHQISNVNQVMSNPRMREGISSMPGNQFGRGAVPRHQESINQASLRSASLMTGKIPVSPSRGSFSATDKAPSVSTIQHAPANTQRFFTSARTGSTGNAMGQRQSGVNTNPQFGGSGHTQAPEGPKRNVFGFPSHSTAPVTNVNRGSVPSSAPASGRQSWHPFTPPPSSGGNRQSTPGASNAPVNHSTSGTGAATYGHPQNAPAVQTAQNGRAGQSGWQRFAPTPHPPQNSAASQQLRQYQPPASNSRGVFTPPQHMSPSQPQRQYQPPVSYPHGNSSASYSRPPLNMRQPIVTPRPSAGSSSPHAGSSSSVHSGGGNTSRGGSSFSSGGHSSGGGHR